MNNLIDLRVLERLDNSLEELNDKRPLKQSTLKKLRAQLSIEMTYHSNAIEGNRLTLNETMMILREGVTIKGKNLQEHLEAKNHEEALNFLFEMVDSKKRLTLSHTLIRQLHQLIVKETETSIAGKYRETDVQILGSKHRPPPGYLVKAKMDDFIKWLSKNEKKYHSIVFAAIAHHLFVAIHPFEDGNGRTGRLLMNLLLMRRGYPISIILKNDRTKYYNALDDADKGQLKGIVRIVAHAVERTLNIYLKSISKSNPKTENILLSELAKTTSYSAKYLNLLARTGAIKAHKEGRNWYSSMKAIEIYQKTRLRKKKQD